MELSDVAAELYGLAPGDFTAVRNQRAAAARATGDRKLAAQIARLPKPTLAAWANNLLVRAAPDQADALLRLGESLREAQQQLAGDQLRELLRQRNVLVRTLARQARQLAADAGHPLSEGAQRDLEQTLHAVLSDPQIARAWAAGQLAKVPTSPAGFTAGSTPAAAARRPDRPRLRPARGEPTTDAKDQRRQAQRHKQLTRARAEAEAAEQQARERQHELQQAAEQRDQARARLEQAEERAASLAEELKAAQREATAAHAVGGAHY